MSDFIVSMALAGFSERPPESKVRPLPTRQIVGTPVCRLAVLHHDEARIVGRALADCQDTAEAALSQLGFIQYGHFQAAALAEPHGFVRQLGGRHGVARAVDQIARKRHAPPRDQP